MDRLSCRQNGGMSRLDDLHTAACSAVERGLPEGQIRAAILAYAQAAEAAGLIMTASVWWAYLEAEKPAKRRASIRSAL